MLRWDLVESGVLTERETKWKVTVSHSIPSLVERWLPLAGFSYSSLLSHPLGTECSEWCDFYGIFFILFCVWQ